ncbi:right-handed parallel beta-helix repeat-containing protein [Haladaptatus sp. NG-WS-4]
MNSRRTCIKIRSDDVIFDGNGHTIDGRGRQTGIDVGTGRALSNVTVTDVTATDWNVGIRYRGTSQSTLSESTVRDNTVGIQVDSARNPRVNQILDLINTILSQFGLSGIQLPEPQSPVSMGNQLINTTATQNDVGVQLQRTTANTLVNTNASQNTRYGIQFQSAQQNSLQKTVLTSNEQGGIQLNDSNQNQANDTRVLDNQVGIQLSSSSNNAFENTETNDNGQWAFQSAANSTNNTAENFTLSNTTIGFRSQDIALQSVTSPPADPANLMNIGKYVNATGTSAQASLLLNVSYTDADVATANVNESSLRIWRYSDGSWSQVSGENTVNTAENYVSATITTFTNTDTFAPLGEQQTGPQPKPKEINSCTAITEPGNYVVTQDILNSTNTSCIDIQTSDVHIDGQGHQIDGVDNPETYGVTGSTTALSRNTGNFSNVTVTNLTLTDWEEGLRLNQASQSRVQNVNAWSNHFGIRLNGGTSNTLTANTAHNNTYIGIYLESSTENMMVGNTASNNSAYGIFLNFGSSNNTLTESIANNNNDHGIAVDQGSSNNELTENTATNNRNAGILVRSAMTDNNTISQNIIAKNQIGVKLQDGKGTTLTDNIATENTQIGILVEADTDNTTVTNNTATENRWGINLHFAQNVVVSQNTVTNNSDIGIIDFEGSNNQFKHNNISNNDFFGFRVRGSENEIIENNTINANTGPGLVLSVEALNNRINGNTVNDNGNSGIHIEDGSDGNIIENNEVHRNVRSGCGCDFDLPAYQGSDYWAGITIMTSSNNLIRSNNITNNLRDGIGLRADSYNNTVQDNFIAGNGGLPELPAWDIYIKLSGSNDIINNTGDDSIIALDEVQDRPPNTITGNQGFTVIAIEAGDHACYCPTSTGSCEG